MLKLKKVTATITLVCVLFSQNITFLRAQIADIPTPPPIPSAPPVPTAPALPSEPPLPSSPPQPTAIPVPATPPPSPSVAPTNTPNATLAPTPTAYPSPTSTPSPTATPEIITGGNGGQEQNGQGGGNTGGNTSIETGDATTNGSITTVANTNESIVEGAGSGIQVINANNGSDSNNSGSIQTVNNNETNQNNNANVSSDLSISTVTGDNSASKNTGGDNSILTGDANTSGTIITAVNTNIDGVSVSQFNVTDDHVGDIVLDFGTSCILGCSSGDAAVLNTGNGADSTNSAISDSTTNNVSFQNNDATLTNSMTLLADSGDNKTSKNTGGDNSIETGNANISANVLTFANNNISGNVYYGEVNIYGNLTGNIVLPQSVIDGLMAGNSNNGSGSNNTASSSTVTNNTTEQNNTAIIENSVNIEAETGDNEIDKNTNGDSNVVTGDSNVAANVLNVVNNNISGGNWWLVIVNEAGKWVGKIIGAPSTGGNIAASEGTEITVLENGEVVASNNGNGVNSNNSANTSSTTNNSVSQNNNAHIKNDVNLVANTGGNDASKNTGGNSSITTGDAKVIANLVNFVNNNISGGGKLLVTVVNVFGSWLGNFIAPGAEAPAVVAEVANNNNNEPTRSVGGVVNIPSTSSDEVVALASPRVAASTFRPSKSSSGFSESPLVSVESADSKPSNVLAYANTNEINSGSGGITINLAWILPVLGFGILALIIKKVRERFI